MTYQDHEHCEFSDQASLVVSILMRYPEISTVRLVPQGDCFQIGLMLQQSIDDELVEKFRAKLRSMLLALGTFTDSRMRHLSVNYVSAGENAGLLQVEIDLASLDAMHLRIVAALARELLGDRVITEPQEVTDMDYEWQDRWIQETLDDIRGDRLERYFIGLREEGRVLVFNRPVALRRHRPQPPTR